jgi:hypothetical protein
MKESDSAAGEWLLAARIVVDAELEAEVAALAQRPVPYMSALSLASRTGRYRRQS